MRKVHLSIPGGFTGCGRRIVSPSETEGMRVLGLTYRASAKFVVPYLDQVTCEICLDSDQAQRS